MSAMEPKSDSVPNESDNIMTSTATEAVNKMTRIVSNEEASPTTETKTDEGIGMIL